MKYSARFVYLIFCILLFQFQSAYAQKTETPQDTIQKVVIDTIYVQGNSFVFTKDSAFFTKTDTVIYVTDTIRTRVEEVVKQNKGEEQQAFYKRLKKTLEKRKVGEQLFDWLFDLNSSSSSANVSKKKSSSPPESADYNGKYVGNIYLKKIDIFGPSVTDTARQAASKLSQFYNQIHINTQDQVLKNNLLLEKGDALTPERLADNERVIRSLRFIRDARLIVQPRANNADTVDLLLITEDVIPYTFDAAPEGFIEGSVEATNVNVLGTGHELSNAIIVAPDESPRVGYEGRYRIPNVRGSFIEGELRYRYTMWDHIRSFTLSRRFVVPDIRYAGGIDVSYNRLTTLDPWVNSYPILDTFSRPENIPFIRYGIFNQDYWLSRSFGVRNFDDRTRLIAAARYNRQYFFERPEVAANTNPAFHHRDLLLFGAGFSRRYYTTETLVYTYGRTEDIPIGQLAEVIAGPEYGEFYNRYYTGVLYSRGGFIPALGYVSASANWGGFWRNNSLEDGVFRLQLTSFSYLIHRRRTRYRVFLKADYTQGVNRTQNVDFRLGLVTLNNEEGIRGLEGWVLEGNERLAISLETVAYPPVNFYSFRMACFVFADAGLIAQTDERLFRTPSYQGLGFGFRVRNENLAFETFQVRFAFYPRTPEGESWFGFRVGSIPIPDFLDFDVRKPEVFRFR
ncbi:hypothetical protein [Tunicatimonas pelagia]|uniref:hypothetical protein n=1 Tax=Tunicatimonas pelagia TaxID=931531 RepID=UPI002665BD47|nr:hypothetical protein [Tunicatimonas pelagia]WKN41963.1 hypothetical protein P0M28_23255 [Tunicatimonas pelagia]